MERAFPVFIVTGLSGSGKSSALRLLEDSGCEVIDNFPLALCQALLSQHQPQRPLALGIDVRTRDFKPENLLQGLIRLRDLVGNRLKVVFFEADAVTLHNRYRATRRLHPLGSGGPLDLLVRQEEALLAPIRQVADLVVDTSHYSLPEMRSYLQHYLPLQPSVFTVYFLSFAFRRGLPHYADFVFDMRFLKNPHYQGDMRALTGSTPAIKEFLAQDPLLDIFVGGWKTLFLETLLPSFQEGGRHSLVIAFGCTGGKHRSVAVSEILGEVLRSNGYNVDITHREMG